MIQIPSSFNKLVEEHEMSTLDYARTLGHDFFINDDKANHQIVSNPYVPMLTSHAQLSN